MSQSYWQSSCRRLSTAFLSALILVVMYGCGGGGASSGTSTTPSTGTTTTSVQSISLATSQSSVKSDNSDTATITATALDRNNAVISGVLLSFSVDSGVLSARTATTDSTGKATVQLSAGATDKSNRTATITVTGGGASAQIPVTVSGTAISINATSATIADDGTQSTATLRLVDAGNNPMSGAALALSTSGTGSATLSSAAPTTDSTGQATVTITGRGAGSVTLTAQAKGAIASKVFTVNPVANAFRMTAPTSSTVALSTNSNLTVSVQAGTASSITFATTIGGWDGTAQTAVVKSVAGGVASATFRSSAAGVANIQVFDTASPGTSVSLVVALSSPASSASSISLQAAPNVLSPSTATAANTAVLEATVTDAGGQPVGGSPVSFTIINPTGGGETISPTVVLTSTDPATGVPLGRARATFTSGSLPSGQSQSAVSVRAGVVGTAITTGGSGGQPDASIVIGGRATSIAIGRATAATQNSDATAYVMPMTVLVSDASGAPVPDGTVVSLTSWPAYFSTGSGCGLTGTFQNEDLNENTVRDLSTEPIGFRTQVDDTTFVKLAIRPNGSANPFTDSTITSAQLVPPNAAGGVIRSSDSADAAGTVKTKNGLGAFTLTYTKSNAVWIVTRIRASTSVAGTQTTSQILFRLPALESELTPCLIQDSPYR